MDQQWRVVVRVFAILLLLGYIILSVYIVPLEASCSSASIVPIDSPIDISLQNWIFGNLVSGIPLQVVLLGLQINICGRCFVILFSILAGIYVIFQNVWSVIGYLTFTSFYQNACKQSGQFNKLITIQIYYGLVLFPLITLAAILLSIITLVTKSKQSDQNILAQNKSFLKQEKYHQAH